jgi:glycosyltransferase involved in cell wall biosynthesis
MKRIGIFLGFKSDAIIYGVSLNQEGIARLLVFLVQGALQNANAIVTIAIPIWFKKTLLDILQDHQVDLTKVELLTGSKSYFWLRRIVIKTIFSNSKAGLGTIRATIKAYVKQKIKNIVATAVQPALPAKFKKLFFQMIFFTTVCLPLLSVFFILVLLNRIYTKLIKPVLNKINGFDDMVHLKEIMTKLNFRLNLKEALINREMNKLLARMNKTDIKAWLIPTANWPEIKSIKTKKIMAVPDIVFFDFPILFGDPFFYDSYQNILSCIESADHFVCYSEYIKEEHLMKPFMISQNNISVIPHGFNDLNEYFKDKNALTGVRAEALQILKEYQREALQDDPYLANFDFTETQYILFPSQARLYKNYLNLVKAYRILLRERFYKLKLIVTGNLRAIVELETYVRDQRLHLDVLSLMNVPSKVLAALNHLAICSVNPTLFEGGFPFTFTEAYSVGTPSVMSNIPMVRDQISDPELQQKMLFDPFDITDIANKIAWAVDNRDNLYNLQTPLYNTFKQRSWSKVANEYIDLLTSFH